MLHFSHKTLPELARFTPEERLAIWNDWNKRPSAVSQTPGFCPSVIVGLAFFGPVLLIGFLLEALGVGLTWWSLFIATVPAMYTGWVAAFNLGRNELRDYLNSAEFRLPTLPTAAEKREEKISELTTLPENVVSAVTWSLSLAAMLLVIIYADSGYLKILKAVACVLGPVVVVHMCLTPSRRKRELKYSKYSDEALEAERERLQVLQNQQWRSVALFSAILAIILFATKPSQTKMRAETFSGFGNTMGAGIAVVDAISGFLGGPKVQFHDYYLWSTLVLHTSKDESTVLAYGFCGQVWTSPGLTRIQNGVSPLGRFLDAYRALSP